MMGEESERSRGARLFRPGPGAEIDEELAFHLQERVREYIEAGMTPEAARAAALERLGDLRHVRSDCTELLTAERRAERRRDWLSDARQDMRFGVRAAVRAPLFSLLAILTLALGIGANAAIFGVLKSVLLDSLPYADADRLVRVHVVHEVSDRFTMSAGGVEDLAARRDLFAGVGAFVPVALESTYAAEAGPQVVSSALVTGDFFQTLGVGAVVGRTLTGGDAGADAARVVVLSHGLWQREFGGDPAVLGRTLTLDGNAYAVVGVLPRGFVGPMGSADVWRPLDLGPTLRDPNRVRGRHWLGVIARLQPGVQLAAAQRELSALAAAQARTHPEAHAGTSLRAVRLRDDMVGDSRTPLLVLMGSAALVLLIACANLAGALLTRMLSRRRELSVRAALGAGRGRLIRQLLTECTLLAAAGGAAGLLLAILGLAVARDLAAPMLPAYADLSLDPGAVLVTALIAICAGVAFGIAPAFSVGSGSVQATLREETRSATESRGSGQLRGALVAGQIALSLSLLAGAGLLARTLWAMTGALGFTPDGVLAVRVALPWGTYTGAAAQDRFFEAFQERLQALPGVGAVASANQVPPDPALDRLAFVIEGQPEPANRSDLPSVEIGVVSGDYFDALRIPLKQGRSFGAVDRPDGPGVVVISEGMARRYWPDGQALGTRIRLLGPDGSGPPVEVIGIAGDVRNDPARPDPEPKAYLNIRQNSWGSRVVLLRVEGGDPLDLVRPVQRELAQLDATLPLNAMLLRDVVDSAYAGRRLPAFLMAAFGALALLLASIGVYAMFAGMAAAREREFAVRVALGSSRRGIARLVLRQGAVWMVVGLAAGAAGVLVVARLLHNLLYGIPPLDPIALGGAIAVLLACASFAMLGPIRRATRADPTAVMR